MSKYGEPLTYFESPDVCGIARADDLLCATATDPQLFADDIRRMIACTNACAGLNPEAIKELVLAAGEVFRTRCSGVSIADLYTALVAVKGETT